MSLSQEYGRRFMSLARCQGQGTLGCFWMRQDYIKKDWTLEESLEMFGILDEPTKSHRLEGWASVFVPFRILWRSKSVPGSSFPLFDPLWVPCWSGSDPLACAQFVRHAFFGAPPEALPREAWSVCEPGTATLGLILAYLLLAAS